MFLRHLARRRGFTLIELIVVILILGILAAVGVVGYTQVTDRANIAATTANLRQVTTATLVAATSTGQSTLTRTAVLAVMNEATGPAVVEGLDAAGWKLGGSADTPTSAGEFALGFDNDDDTAQADNDQGTRAALVTAASDGTLLAQVFTAAGAGPIVRAAAGATPAIVLGAAPAGSTAPVLSDDGIIVLPPPPPPPPPPAPLSFSYAQTVLPADTTQALVPTAVNANGPLTYSVTGALPTGVTFDSSTGAVTGPPKSLGAVQVAAGSSHTLAVGTDGAVWAWGLNSLGRLGDGTATDRLAPVKVALPEGLEFVAVAAGGAHSLAAAADGTVWAWGDNASRQLGDGTTTIRSTPVQVSLPEGVHVEQVAAGANFSLALASDGTVWSWGAAAALGRTATNTPAVITHLTGKGVTQISAGNQHAVAVTSAGALYAWGSNAQGQLGDGTVVNKTTPVLIAASGTRQAVAGYGHTLALRTNGVVVANGANPSMTLGTGQTGNPVKSPGLVQGLNGKTIASIAAGYNNGFAVTATGEVYAWGTGGSGQLGILPDQNRTAATLVTALSATPVSAVLPAASSATTTMFLTTAGTVLGTGTGYQGQLGTGTATNSFEPVTAVMFTAHQALEFTVTVTATAADGRTATSGPITFTRP